MYMCACNICYTRSSRDLLVVMLRLVCAYRRNSYRALSNRRWKELRYVEVSIQPRNVRPQLPSRRR